MNRKIIIFGICIALLIPLVNTASANSPPEKPTIDGPTSGNTGTSYTYRFCSNDPDGDDIYYCVDWGDGVGEVCIGPVSSGTCLEEDHTWTSDGDYTIKVKAQDTNQEESDYATLSVSMPKSKTLPVLFQHILEKILIQFPVLRILLD
jgi:hypothetical protein